MQHKPVLTLDDAKRIAAAADTYAASNGWRVTIAIVDDGGHLLYLQRSHNTKFGTVETAIAKAYAAIAFQRPTKASEDAVLSGRLIHLALPSVIPAEGGIPISVQDTIVGAVGISGISSAQDGLVAAAGLAALAED